MTRLNFLLCTSNNGAPNSCSLGKGGGGSFCVATSFEAGGELAIFMDLIAWSGDRLVISSVASPDSEIRRTPGNFLSGSSGSQKKPVSSIGSGSFIVSVSSSEGGSRAAPTKVVNIGATQSRADNISFYRIITFSPSRAHGQTRMFIPSPGKRHGRTGRPAPTKTRALPHRSGFPCSLRSRTPPLGRNADSKEAERKQRGSRGCGRGSRASIPRCRRSSPRRSRAGPDPGARFRRSGAR